MSVASSKRIQRLQSLRSSIKQLSIVSNKTDKIHDKCRRLSIEISLDDKLISSLRKIQDVRDTCTISINSFVDKYRLVQKIGEGANGCVYKCQHKKNNKIFAVKKFKVSEQEIFYLKKHFVYYRQLSCELVIQYKGLYFDDGQRTAYLVMQYYNHPNLDKAIIKDEEELKNITKKIIQALKYLHGKNICHRDIKPENILYNAKMKTIKLIDFGISKPIFRKGIRREMLTIVGSPLFLAPQIYLGGGYDERVDIWSLGVTIYKLVTGNMPFQSEYIKQSIENIKKIRVSYDDKQWNVYSPLAKYFVSYLLKYKQQRMTLEQASDHLWLNNPQTFKFRRSLSQLQRRQIFKVCTKEEGMSNCQEECLNFQTKNLEIDKEEFDLLEEDEDEDQFQFQFNSFQKQKNYVSNRLFTPNSKSQVAAFTMSGSCDSLFIS